MKYIYDGRFVASEENKGPAPCLAWYGLRISYSYQRSRHRRLIEYNILAGVFYSEIYRMYHKYSHYQFTRKIDICKLLEDL